MNESFAAAATDPRFAGILVVTGAPIVSADIIGQAYVSVLGLDTRAIGAPVKGLGWYDNEWVYSNRLLELAALIGARRGAAIPELATR